jgi:Zn-dependent protease
MLRWSTNLFRIRGIQLAVHSSFWLLLAYVAYEGWRTDGAVGLIWSVAALLAFFTCVVLHELGHSFTAIHFGVGVRRILLMPIGGMAEFESIPRQPSRELLITLAGPAVNFVIAAVLWLTVGSNPGSGYPLTVVGLAHLLLYANVVMGLFNLVPVFPMDGGRIFRALLVFRLPYLRATFWAAKIGNVLALLAAVIAAFVFNNFLTAALFVFIYFAGDLEYRMVKRRETENARWRERLEAYSHPLPAKEPPVLWS